MLKAQKQKGQNLGGAWSVGEGFRERVSFALLAQKGWMWGGEQLFRSVSSEPRFLSYLRPGCFWSVSAVLRAPLLPSALFS